MSPTYTELLLAACILILPFLYESSHVFRYRLKFMIYYGYIMFMAVFLIPVFIIRAKSVRNLLIAAVLCRPISTIIGLRWLVRGKEYLQKNQSYIIVSNHQSSIDVLGIFEIWNLLDKCTVVAKREVLYAGPFGLASYLCGLIFIPRSNPKAARIILNTAADQIKIDKTKLWVFPEGTRRNTGHIHEFKKGAFHLAVRSNIPILPVVYSQYYFLDKNNKRFDHGRVLLTALPPISTDGMTVEDIPELMEKTRNAMMTTFHESNKEIKEMLFEPFSSQWIDKLKNKQL